MENKMPLLWKFNCRGLWKIVYHLQYVNNVRNQSVLYYRGDPFATHYDKLTITLQAPTYQVDDRVVKTIEENGKLINEMQYKM